MKLFAPSIFPRLFELISLSYLLFIPGLLLLSLSYNISINTVTIVYSIGASTIFVTTFGFLANLLIGQAGFSYPLSREWLIPLLIATTTVIQIVHFYYGKLDISISRPNEFKYLIVILTAPASLIIFGKLVYRGLGYDEILILGYLCIILLYLVYFTDSQNTNLRPYVVLSAAITLPLSKILISPYVVAGDKSRVFYIAKYTTRAEVWDPSIPNKYNTVLTETIFPAVLSNSIGISTTYVFEYVYSAILAVTLPLILYNLFTERFDQPTTYHAVFIFIFSLPYINSVSHGMKQGFAMLFIGLVILTVSGVDNKSPNKRGLSLIFGLFIVATHYGSAYLFMIIILIGLVMFYITTTFGVDSSQTQLLTTSYISILIVGYLSWHIYTGSGTLFTSLSLIGADVGAGFSDLFGTSTQSAANQVVRPLPSLSLRVLKYIYILLMATSGLGLLTSVIRNRDRVSKPTSDFFYFGLGSYALFVLVTVIPTGMPIDTLRLFGIAFLVLSPYSVLGIQTVVTITERIFDHTMAHGIKIPGNYLIAGFVLSFSVFGLGLPAEINNDYQHNLALAQPEYEDIGGPNEIMFYGGHSSNSDLKQAKWLGKYKNPRYNVTVDNRGEFILISYGGYRYNSFLPPLESGIVFSEKYKDRRSTEYVFFRSYSYNRSIYIRPSWRHTRGYQNMYLENRHEVSRYNSQYNIIYKGEGVIYAKVGK